MNSPSQSIIVPPAQVIATLSRAPVAALLVDGTGTILYANPVLLALFGYTHENLLCQSLELLLPENLSAAHKGQTWNFPNHAVGIDLYMSGRHSDGTTLPLEVRLQHDDCESESITVIYLRDRRQEQAGYLEQERMNRFLRLMHDCNRILVRARNENELLSDIVQCLVKIGLYPQVWAGFLPTEGEPFAAAVCAGYQRPCLTCPDSTGSEPVALLAMESKKPFVVPASELAVFAPQLCPLHSGQPQPALIALPLQTASAMLGCLCVTSSAANPFPPDEVELLQQLADDLAFGLDAQRSHALSVNAEARLRLLERAVEASVNAIIIADARDPAHPIVYANQAFERMTGYTASEALGRNGRFLLGDDSGQAAVEVIRAAVHDEIEAQAMVRNYRKDGSLLWNELTISPVRDPAGVVTHFVSVMNDVTAHKAQAELIERHSLFDDLTGLPNRCSLFERIAVATETTALNGNIVGVALIALNRFSLVNDAYGHDIGDVLLREVGKRLLATLHDRDTVARLGGDEFVVLLSRVAPERAISVIEKIRSALNRPFELTCGEVLISASIGVSFSPRDGNDAQTLIRNAEVAMQGAKTAGWNAVRYYAEDMNRRTGERLAMEFDLRRALDRQEFEIHYQPIIDVSTGLIVEAEALLRWRRPEQGLVPPDQFIPLTESSGLIIPIGQWVVHEACRQIALWRAMGMPPISIAVNLSACQFSEPGLEEMVAEALVTHGLSGDNLVLEVTESLLMTNLEVANETLLRLKQLGVKISLDDFGTGYSSLSYLKQLPLDTLKIDRSFVRDIGTDPNDAAIATTIIFMARTMHLGVIAEGVENQEQMAHLRQHGCQRVQGYLFSQPLPASGFESLLTAQRPPST